MQSLSSPETPFAPLPVRARGTLEIFDTAFKLLRRYAGVLFAWSFLSCLINLVPIGGLGYIFTMPLVYGATACVIAAAVRGQKVSFGQVWGFTKPRYGALLGVLILGTLLLFAIAIGVGFAATFLAILFAAAGVNYGIVATVVTWIVGILGGAVITTLLTGLTVGYMTLAPLVACLEDGYRSTSSLSRAWSLLSGNWRKACAVSVILSLALGASLAIVLGFAVFLFGGGWDKMLGANLLDSPLAFLGTYGVYTLWLTLTLPILTLVIGVFYLDLRSRKEALDLEWTNYAAKPEMTPEEMARLATNQAPAPAAPPPPPNFNAANGAIGYAPGSSLPAPATPSPPPAPATSPPPLRVSPPPAPSTSAAPSISPTPVGVQAATSPDAAPPPTPAAPVRANEIAPVPQPLTAAPDASRDILSEFAAQIGVAPEEIAPAAPVEAMPVPPPVPVPEAAPRETSSFAPPRRVVRDEDDYPSSFSGGGARP